MKRTNIRQNVIRLLAGVSILTVTSAGIGDKVEAASSYSGTITASSLNVRTSPSTNGKILGQLHKGNTLIVSNYDNSWVQLTYKGKIAYISKQYIKASTSVNPPPTQSPAIKGKVTASSLNIRSTYSASSKIVGNLAQSDIVNITDEKQGWFYIQVGAKKGWVLGKYVSKITTPSPQTKPVPAPFPVATNYKTMNIRYPSRVTAIEINNYIRQYESYTGKTSVFHDQGQMFIRIGTETGINQLILAAMAIHESAYGTNILSKGKYNLFSVGAYDSSPYDSSYKFNTAEQAVRYQAYFLKSGYLNPASWKFKGYYLGDAIGGLNYYYASDKQWGEKIANHANKIHAFNPAEYTNISIMKGTASVMAIPAYAENFSTETKAIANSTISVKNSMEGSEITSIPQGAKFSVLTKYNNQWFKVTYNGIVGYLKVDLSNYKNYFTIKNLVRTADFKYYTQVLENDNAVVKNGQTKVWVNGKTQWISTKGLENVFR